MITDITNTNSLAVAQVQTKSSERMSALENPAATPPENNDSSSEKVTLSQKARTLQQDFNREKTSLKAQYDQESQALERQYLQEKNQLEREFSQKKRALKISIYA